MKLNKQEQKIKEKMQSFRPQVDTNELWDSLSTHVPKRKRRFGLFFFIAASFLLIGIIGFLTYSLIDNNKSNSTNQNELVNNQIDNNKTQITNNSSNQSEIKTDNIQSKSSKKQQNNNLIKTHSKKSKSLGQYSLINTKKENNRSVYNNYKNITVSNSQFEKNNSSSLSKLNQSLKIKENSTIIKRIFSSHLSILKLKPINHEKKEQIVATKIVFPKTVSRNYFLWNIGFGLGYFKHSFNPLIKENDEFSKYLNSSSKPAPMANIAISYHFANKYYIKSGFIFSQLVTQIHPKWELILEEENNNPNGVKQRVVRSASYEAIAHNYQNSIDIPLTIGVNIFNQQRFNISIEGGLLFNIFTYSKGAIYDESYKLFYYDNYNNNPYKKRFDIGWNSSIMLNYRLKNFDIFFNPSISSKSINYKISNLKIKEKYRIYDLKVGLRYML